MRLGKTQPEKYVPPKRLDYNCCCGEQSEYGIFYYDNEQILYIDSCCGGCVSAINIKYCPFCGKKIEV